MERLKKFVKYKKDPFNTYASVIDSISTIRMVWYKWDFPGRKCNPPSKLKKFLFYLQVANHFIFTIISCISFVWYFYQEKHIRVSSVVSDGLILTGVTYGLLYQVSSLIYGRDAEFHVNQQIELNKQFASAMGVPVSDKWNQGVLYLFCHMCSATRPNFGLGTFPYFLKEHSPMSLYYRLGYNRDWSTWFYLYSAWSAYVLGVSYVITNYYAILTLAHAQFNSYWLKLMKKRMLTNPTEENQRITAKIYKKLQILNTVYHPAYGKLILPTVIIFASAWAVLATVVLIKLLKEMDALALFMILTAASQAIGFLSLKFYFSHRMRRHSHQYLDSRQGADKKDPYWAREGKTLSPLGIRVGGFYMISIEDLQVWAETLVNYILLLLSAL